MTITQFKIEKSWKYQMDNSKGLDSWNNYSGGMDKPDWIVVVGRNRDSDILQESNFECALEQLGGESKNVSIANFGHWACGWFELLLVNPKSKKHVKLAFEIHQSLKDYPVLDEDDFCSRENDAYSEYAESVKHELAEALAKHFDLKVSRQLVALAYQLNIEAQHYSGADACVNVYEMRAPDVDDINQLKSYLEQIYVNKGDYLFNTIVKLKAGIEKFQRIATEITS